MNEAHLCIDRMTPQDIAAVSRLARSVWQATYPALISQAQIDAMLADRYGAERIRKQLDEARQTWRVARQNGVPVGFAHALLEDGGCKLDKLYVHTDLQRRGIGAALLREIEGWARDHRCARLWLQVNRGNVQAVRAYQKYGFNIAESRVFDIGDGFVMDDHVMEKPL